MIRHALLQDVPAIEKLLLRAKRRTELCTVKVNFEKGRKNIRRCIQSALGFAMVAERGEKITGTLLAMQCEYWYSNERYVTDMGFVSYARGDGRLLLRRCRSWADAHGAKMLMGTFSLDPRGAMRRVYEGEGLYMAGHTFVSEKPINVPNIRMVPCHISSTR